MTEEEQAAFARLTKLQQDVFRQWKETVSHLAECQSRSRLLEIQNENLKAAIRFDLLQEKQNEVNLLKLKLKEAQIVIEALQNRLIDAGLVID